MVKEKRQLIQELSDLLLEKETIDLKQIVGVLGERPFEAKSTYKAYLEEVNYSLTTFISLLRKPKKKKKLKPKRTNPKKISLTKFFNIKI